MRSMAMRWSSRVIFGCCCTQRSSLVLISSPVVSLECRMRRLPWPPSRPRSNSPSFSVSKSTPQLSSSSMAAGASSTMVRTAASSQSPAPASSVSATCSSKVSFLSITAAIPPWALAELEMRGSLLQRMVTLPYSAARRAKLSPATPLPITRKSVVVIAVCWMRAPFYHNLPVSSRAMSEKIR